MRRLLLVVCLSAGCAVSTHEKHLARSAPVKAINAVSTETPSERLEQMPNIAPPTVPTLHDQPIGPLRDIPPAGPMP